LTAADKIPGIRADLRDQLGREPTVSEVARGAGVSPERARQLYVRFGWDTQEGHRVKRKLARQASEARAARVEARRQATRELNASIVTTARTTDLTIHEIARKHSVSYRRAQAACAAAGVHRLRRFTADEDELVLDESRTLAELGRLLNRDPGVLRARRRLLLSGAARPVHEEVEVLEAFDRHRSWTEAARELGLTVVAVRRIVRGCRGGWFLAECLRDDEAAR
jgi:hypothetical protein